MTARTALFPFLTGILLATIVAMILWPRPAASQGGATVPLDEGWNNVAYAGDALDTPVALNDILDVTRSVWRWRSLDGSWQSWTKGAQAFLNSLASLGRDDILWLLLAAPGAWTQIGAAQNGGTVGLNCWDLDGDGVFDPEEDIDGDGAPTALDCRGTAGEPGPEGPEGVA